MIWLVVGFAVVMFFALTWWLLASTSRAKKKADGNAATILNATFNGQPHVTVQLNMRTLDYGTYVTGATERGYQLTAQNTNQYGAGELVFSKLA